ncbi:MAG: Fic family protein [Sphaerochaetaceae bacterium]|nr:Fic family protein [Sphaerochaetaceae bacterium]
MQRCIDYIRFNQESEGFEMSSDDEVDISAILNKDKTADELIQKFLIEHNLDSVEYKASDLDYSFYPGTRCLSNYFSIKDREELRRVVIYLSSMRAAEFLLEPIDGPYSLEHLQQIHEHLFGDVYPSAGVIRTKTAAKRTEFCLPEYIEVAGKEIFDRLAKEHFLRKLDREQFIGDLAYYMGEIEALHPFRTGNAPTARLFFIILTQNAGWQVEWSEADPDGFLEADICAIDGDYQPLIDVLEEVIYPKE